jgi:nucleoside-diphosphate-sugar epimerase
MTPAAPSPRRLVITGASGFVGRALATHAQAHGNQVVALSRSDGSLRDYEDVDALARAFAQADAVVHLAALAHRQGTPEEFAASVRATEAVVAAARRAGVGRLVHLSSIGVNGIRTDGRPFTEDDPPRPVEPYAHSKLQAERAVIAARTGGPLETVIVRPPLVYGPNAPGNFGRLVRLVRRGWPLPFGAIDNARTFIALENLVDFLTLCTTHPAAADQLLLVGDSEDLSTPELVRCIAAGLDVPARLLSVAPAILRLGETVFRQQRLAGSLFASLQVDSSKARRLLGWRPPVAAAEAVRSAARQSRFP